MRLPLISAIVAMAAGAAACAPMASDPYESAEAAASCFRGDQVENFRVDTRNAVYIRSRQGNVFKLETPGSCFEPGTTAVGITPYTSSSPRICAGDQARVQVARSSSTPLTCIAQVSGPIDDSAVSGLPTRSR